ncbi:MAG: hypothetical protein QOI91_1495 [Solirubrobacteraceae bacterium]|jgi:hypothetical protein|nr:hypothetical protein [Solirubrobacteraceae bacterium]
MARNVKRRGGGQVARATISSKHQVTIAKRAFDEAGFRAGDVVAVRALGPGRVELASLEALFDKHRGRLATGGELRRAVDELRAEWD